MIISLDKTELLDKLTDKVCENFYAQDGLRKLLFFDKLKQGDMAKYQADEPCPVLVERKASYEVVLAETTGDLKHIIVPTFDIANEQDMNFNLDALAVKIADDLIDQENKRIIELLRHSVPVHLACPSYGHMRFFHNSFLLIEGEELVCTSILCHPDDLEEFIQKYPCNFFDIEDDDTVMLWTARFVTSPLVNPGNTFFLADPDYLGVIAGRQSPCCLRNERENKIFTYMSNGYAIINRYAGIMVQA